MEPPWSLSALSLVLRPTVAPPCLNKGNLLLLRSSFFFLPLPELYLTGFPGGAMVKNPPANAGDATDIGSTPGWGLSPGEGNGKPIQYSCLENSMDRGAWQAIGSQRVRYDWAGMHIHIHIHIYIYIYTYICWLKLKLESRFPGEISITSDDDTTVMAESEEELKNLLMKEDSEKAGLKLNIQKTKIIVSGPIT